MERVYVGWDGANHFGSKNIMDFDRPYFVHFVAARIPIGPGAYLRRPPVCAGSEATLGAAFSPKRLGGYNIGRTLVGGKSRLLIYCVGISDRIRLAGMFNFNFRRGLLLSGLFPSVSSRLSKV